MTNLQQQRYQIRFDWGAIGASRIAVDADVVVVVDELDGHGRFTSAQLAAQISEASAAKAVVFSVTETSASDAASRILQHQTALGRRAVVAIVAAGSVDQDGYRVAVEDALAAGALVDALAALGLDASAPEASVAWAAWQSLRRATGHLLTASVSAAALGSGTARSARQQRDQHSPHATVVRAPTP